MSFSIYLPPSVVTKMKKLKEEPKKESRVDWHKQKELEETGTVPAMTDEEGKEINPHIPQYIMQAPWYYQATHATQKHQRIQEEQYQEKLSSEKKENKKRKHKRKRKNSSSSSDSDSEDDEKVKERKLRGALIREDEHQKRAEHLLSLDERKRPYNSMYENVAPTEEEMEAWRLKRRRTEDPMSHFTS